jgi:hypothetical protein
MVGLGSDGMPHQYRSSDPAPQTQRIWLSWRVAIILAVRLATLCRSRLLARSAWLESPEFPRAKGKWDLTVEGVGAGFIGGRTRPPRVSDVALVDGILHKLGSIFELQFVHDFGAVAFYRMHADAQQAADILVGSTFCYHFKNLPFARGQRIV